MLCFQLRHSESCCFQVCCQTLFSQQGISDTSFQEREREISLGCDTEWQDHSNWYDSYPRLKASGLQVIYAITWQGRCDGITDMGDDEIHWDSLKSLSLTHDEHLHVIWSGVYITNPFLTVWPQSFRGDSGQQHLALSILRPDTNNIHQSLGHQHWKLSHFSLLFEKPDQNICKNECILVCISSKKQYVEMARVFFGIISWQLC